MALNSQSSLITAVLTHEIEFPACRVADVGDMNDFSLSSTCPVPY